MSKNDVPTTASSGGGGFFSGLLKFLFVVVTLGGVIALGVIGYSEMLRLRTVEQVQKQTIELLRSDVDDMMTQRLDLRLGGQETASERTAEDVTMLESAVDSLEANLVEQSNMLMDLDSLSADTAVQTIAITESVSLLAERVTNLQTQVDAGDTVADAVDAELDGLDEQTRLLAEEITAVADNTAVNDTTIRLLHVWSLVTRTRFQLAERDFRDAEVAIRATQTAVQNLIDTAPDLAENLTTIQEDIEEAASVIQSDATTAGTRLETAWETLDTLIAQQLGYQPLTTPENSDDN